MPERSDYHLRGAEWLSGVTDEMIAAHVGEASFERGLGYANTDDVLSLSAADQGRVLLGTVQGNRSTPYTLLITRTSGHAGAPRWMSRCSCPMTSACKHVAAALLVARDLVGGEVQPVAAWRDFVQQHLQVEPAAVAAPAGARSGIQLGLRFEVTRELMPGGGLRPVTRVRLHPTNLTKTGRWTKTKAWEEIQADHRRAFDKQQAEAVSGLRQLWAAQRQLHPYYTMPPVYLDQFPAGLWERLRAAIAVGVEFLPTYGTSGDIEVLGDSVSVLVDMTRQDDGSLRAQAEIGGLDSVHGGELLMLGDPVHGVAIAGRNGDVTLAEFDRPLGSMATALLTQGPLVVPAEDAQEFLDLYYPKVARQLQLIGDVEPRSQEPVRLLLTLTSPAPHTVDVNAHLLYAGRHAKPVTPQHADRSRDPRQEHALVERVEPLLHRLGLTDSIGGLGRWPVERAQFADWRAVRLLEALPHLQDHDDIEVRVDGDLPAFEESTADPQISIGATDSDDNDWLDLHVTVTIDGEDVPFEPLFAALARGDEAMLLDSGTWFSLDIPELMELERLIAEARTISDKQREGLSINRFHLGLWEELENLGVIDQQSQRWADQIARIRGLDAFTAPRLPAGLNAELRSYQRDGFTWLAALWDCALGGVLADDMGLGKTLQTLALLARAREEGELVDPVLVVAPSSVVGTWVREAARFVPELRVVALDSTGRRRGTSVQEAIAHAEVVVTSYAVLRLDADEFAECRWNGLVLDEAQWVKNHQSKTFQAAKRIGAPFTLAITGTPLENSLMDLWSMLALAAPGLYPRPETFSQHYRKPIERGESPELLDQLRRRIRPLMLRRTKEQVASDLPPKQVQVLAVDLGAKHQQVYDRHLQRERQRILGLLDDPDANRVEILASLTKLRQLALDPRLVDETYAARELSAKLAVLVDQITELATEGHRALVFSQFTSYLKLAQQALGDAGLTTAYLDGRTRKRQAVIDSFKDGDQAAFLISLKAGGVGLTLTEADYVFVLDPWWNPATEAQAIDRAHRIGQDKPVMVYRLVSAKTIEEKVVALQERKRDLFAKVVDGGGDGVGAAITPEDIRGLLEG
ncbi:DEAD/DEAH box helicase [Rudaeicoccus suwonensis]|uniref:SNF2 family DNA or RNA helicase n=1 Tax=Rudaeicoccus suwonensis TaxID=657409 RepID=A0A561E3J6_9MICO|nr:DEAD/DEAH box helicase [Rudaeicoccus suwonensis]TWE10170.1 SNF2 family DNA or RNA helicase [Rudaeicoccus suwonensis]